MVPSILYADVIVDLSIDSVDKPFQYKVPNGWEERAVVGACVTIPFGNGNRIMKGYIIGLSYEPKFFVSKIKCIQKIEERELTTSEQLLQLAVWMKERYGCTMNEAIKTVMPMKRTVKIKEDRTLQLAISLDKAKAFLAELEKKANTGARVRLLKECICQGTVQVREVKKKLNLQESTIQSLINNGIIRSATSRVYRNPIGGGIGRIAPIQLNHDQQMIVDAINQNISLSVMKNYLIHGITGSGKTEVYMAIMERVIHEGKQVILLIPEIALTFQTVQRFYGRFGDRVSILNSRLSEGERFDQYERIRQGEVDIIIGPRSALFAPTPQLSLIIIDEEHEGSYKSELTPKYHARDVAMQRAKLCGGSVILGSATPSIDTYYRTELPEDDPSYIVRYEMNKRTGSSVLPEVDIIDMRQELKEKNFSMLSTVLVQKMTKVLNNKEQIMLFINRRGYSGFVSCRSCGEAIKCPHCDVSLTLHKLGRGTKEGHMTCHYCGYTTSPYSVCPSCGSPYIGGFGTGTEKVVEIVQKQFPEAKILRMDADTTAKKGDHARILEAFSKKEADILIGTQMIIKGHDFPEVTLVGILAADLSLNISEYTAAERTFQMLVQAQGRAGRSYKRGTVVVQTYQPEHYSVEYASRHDYKSFYERELMFRILMGYPPVSHILTICVSSTVPEESYDTIHMLRKRIEHDNVIGPAPHAIYKLQDNYRNVMHVKAEDIEELVLLRDDLQQAVVKGCVYFDLV